MISIIIPVHNCFDYTKQCIASIESNTHIPYEIIVVDNGSDNKDFERLNNIQDIEIIRFKYNKGFPKAVNAGLKKARFDILCILNNDVVVTDRWASRLIEHLKRYDMIGPCSNFVNGKQKQNLSRFFDRNESVNWIIGFCMVLKRKVINEIGYLDESFGIGQSEDIDFCIRAKKAGFNIGIAHDVYVHHHGHVTFKHLGLDSRALCLYNRQKLYEKWGAIDYSQ